MDGDHVVPRPRAVVPERLELVGQGRDVAQARHEDEARARPESRRPRRERADEPRGELQLVRV